MILGHGFPSLALSGEVHGKHQTIPEPCLSRPDPNKNQNGPDQNFNSDELCFLPVVAGESGHRAESHGWQYNFLTSCWCHSRRGSQQNLVPFIFSVD